MKDINVVHYVASQLWSILPDKWAELVSALAFHASGGKLSAEDIKARIGDGGGESAASQRGAVAVIPLRGVIAHRLSGMEETSGGASVERFGQMFRSAMANDGVGSIVIDVDSPGGTVTGLQEMAAEMLAARGKKPVIAVANGLMASAAYWLGATAEKIYVTPSGSVGSIGVFTAHQDLSAALEKNGIKVTLISAGKFKTEGNPFEPLSEEAQGVLQARVNDAYGQFVNAVAKGRGVSASDVRGGFGEGRVLSAKDALAAGMVDGIATLDQVIAKQLGGKSSRVGMRAAAEDAVRAGVLTLDEFKALEDGWATANVGPDSAQTVEVLTDEDDESLEF